MVEPDVTDQLCVEVFRTDDGTTDKNYSTTEEEARKAANKLIAEKTKKGYVNNGNGTRDESGSQKKYTLSCDRPKRCPTIG